MTASDEGARTANIFDVARLAGVSHQTVSRVINELPNVRPATRERVQKAIAQLRYSPSPAARALVTRRTRTIGLVAPAEPEFGPTSIATNVILAAREARYGVETVATQRRDEHGVRAAVEELLRQRVDAIVVIVSDTAVLEAVRSLDLAIPLVVTASGPRPSPTVASIDQYRGARSAVRHLVELGYRRVLHLAGPSTAPDAIERMRGWRDELGTHGLTVEDPTFGDWSAASGFDLAGGLGVEVGSAVFAGNDQMSIGLLSALRARGLRVPEDVSVVGFDDIPEAPYLFPPLTTVRQDFARLGQLVMQKVLLAVEDPETVTADSPLPTRLIVRASTAHV